MFQVNSLIIIFQANQDNTENEEWSFDLKSNGGWITAAFKRVQ
jgi:hypothetical protein